jgi:heme A synthase
MRTRTYPWIALLATLLTFVVIVLGAYTRITDAGLSCPDWPGCYGQLTVPSGDTEVQQAAQMYPEKPVEAAKAWTEMVHRYCAGTVGLMILFLTLQAQRQRHQLGVIGHVDGHFKITSHHCIAAFVDGDDLARSLMDTGVNHDSGYLFAAQLRSKELSALGDGCAGDDHHPNCARRMDQHEHGRTGVFRISAV